jgi:anthranilate phosphoribosyltransferase
MSDLSQVIKVLCGRADGGDQVQGCGAASISPGMMRGAFAAILDTGASELEVGALMAAAAMLESRHEGQRFAEVLLGLYDAIRERMLALPCDCGSGPVVVLPNYGDAGRTASTPLLALLLRRLGVKVLVHGALETYGGLFNCGIFRDFGILPCTTRGQLAAQLRENGIALVPATLFSPGLAAMLSLKNRLGIQTPGHVLANLLMPLADVPARILHVLEVPAWLKPNVENENFLCGAHALLLAVSPDHFELRECRPHIALRDGEGAHGWQQLFSAEPAHTGASALHAPALATDPRAWSRWTREQVTGNAVLPQPIVNLLASCLYGCGYAGDLHHAKAIAAVGGGNLAAA